MLSLIALHPGAARRAVAIAALAATALSAGAQLTLPLNQTASVAGSAAFRIANSSATNESSAILGEATSLTGVIYGVRGTAASPQGRGVIGRATAVGGGSVGCFGESLSIGGRGTVGFAAASSGPSHGVYGETGSAAGVGVYGRNTAAGSGVYGEALSANGRGVVGFAVSTSGASHGVYGETGSASGVGVYGVNTAAGGVGVRAESSAGTALAVVGTSTHSGTATFSGTTALSVGGNVSINAGNAINCNGTLTFGGTALTLALGDSSGDAVTVPGSFTIGGAILTLGDTDEDQSIQFFDGGVSGASTIFWDDVVNPAITCGTIGTINSAFIWDLSDNSNSAWLFNNGADSELTIGSIGDIEMDGTLTQNGACDLAEAFLGDPNIEAGTVVVLDLEQPEAVRPADRPYDSRLAGVVSTRPGVLLRGPTADAYPLQKDLKNLLEQRGMSLAADAALDARIDELEASLDGWTKGQVPVALAGRVPVKVDATYGAIRPGDALTSSPTVGHAMKAAAAGPIIGFAITGLENGRGEVVVFLRGGYHVPAEATPRAANAEANAETPNRADGAAALVAQLATQNEAIETLRNENAALLARLERIEALLQERTAPETGGE